MTLEQAIKHCEEVAEEQERKAQSIGRQLVGRAIANYQNDCFECAADHRQLAEWLRDLKEAKRLLKAAMEDMNVLYESGKDEGCVGIKFKWRYADEVEKLLGGLNVNQIKC